MTITEHVSVDQPQQESDTGRSIWYYLLLVSFVLWLVWTLFGLTSTSLLGAFLISYVTVTPLVAVMLLLDRRWVRAAGTNRAYVESSSLLGRWVLGRPAPAVLLRLGVVALCYLAQVPIVALVPWYVTVVRRRAFRGDDPVEAARTGTDAEADVSSDPDRTTGMDTTEVLTLTAQRSAAAEQSAVQGSGSDEPNASRERPRQPDDSTTTDSDTIDSSTVVSDAIDPTTTIDAAATRARALVVTGDQHADADEYVEAQSAYERARDEYERAVQLARERRQDGADYVNVEWFETELERLDERLDACVTARFEHRLDEAERVLAAGEPARAETAFADLVVELSARADADDLSDLLDAAQDGHVRAWVERARAEVTEADRLVEREEFTEAKSTYEAALERLEGVREAAREYDVESLSDEVDALVDHCEAGVRTCERSIRTGPPVAIEDFLRGELPAYELERQLGGGGNADVYELRHTETGERVALKVPRWRFNRTLLTKDVERFVREAETWERVDTHPNIVDVIDYGKLPFPWMLLELMETSLRERFERMTLRERVDVLIDVASALEYAHGHATVHLDVKPENILLDETGVPKVADWGLARVVFEITKSQFGLTPAYSAPEQIKGRAGDLDRQTDVYQFGALAYEVLTGQLPFDAEGSFDLAQQILTEAPTPPSSLNPALPAGIDDAVLKALSKQKADRYEAIIQFRDALRAVRDEVPAS